MELTHLRLLTYQYFLIYITSFVSLIALIVYTIQTKENVANMFMKKAIIYSCVLMFTWLNGKIALEYYQLRINYTRKINHMIVWLIPFTVDKLVDTPETQLSILWNIYMVCLSNILWMIPSREFDKTGILNTIYSTLDRPEDRPNTLLWLWCQTIGIGLFLLPFGLLWSSMNLSNYLFVPLITLTFGDGFAEIIGVKYGKHKYNVSACCTTQRYTRSLEGSSCVYIVCLFVISMLGFVNDNTFTLDETIVNMIIIPPIATFAEAYSPHTLDNPIIILLTSIPLTLVHLVLK
jgi:dolichol kinase